MPLNPRRSLIVRILLPVLLVQVVLLLFLGYGVRHAMNRYAQVQSTQLVEAITAPITTALAAALSAGDGQAMQRRVLELQSDDPLLAYLRVTDAKGRFTASAGHIPAAGDEGATTSDVTEQILPIRVANEVAGQARIGVDVSPVLGFRRELSRAMVLLFAVHLVLSTLVIGIVLWYATRRLRSLDQAARSVSTGALKRVEEQGAADEIGCLAHSFAAGIETLERQREEQLEQKNCLRAVLSAINLGILFETPDHRVEYVNPAFCEMWLLDPQREPTGRPVADLLARTRELFTGTPNDSRYMLQPENAFENSEQQELVLADGRIMTQVSYLVRDPENHGIGRLWLYQDVTHERHTAEQLLYLAERDSLTGLFNRHRFQVETERMISLAQRYDHRFALLYLDLDEFKLINDSYGHREGDTVLTRIAGELARVVRKNDIFARLGGDEFAIVTLIDRDLEEVKQLAQRIVNAVARIPFRFESHNFRITTSVGIAVYPDMSRDPESLVTQADAAMYQAKSQGKNTWSLYDSARDTSVTMMAHMNWTQRIEHGLENDLFEVFFQGIYHVESRELAHLEALVRLCDPDNESKFFMPGQFVPIAEKSGKILAIDQWVLRRVIRMLSEHPLMPPVAVNISGRSFDDPSLPQRIRQWLTESRVDPARLMIELTETAAVSDIQDAQRFIEALHQTGCKVCLDDFGSGFSSFAYLKHIAADVLKIDGQFIHDLPNNPENQIFLRALLDVAVGLKKTTVAEFVDSEAVLDMLSDFGVDLAQGYFLDRPCRDHPAIPGR